MKNAKMAKSEESNLIYSN